MIGVRVPSTHSKELLFRDDGLLEDLKSDRIGQAAIVLVRGQKWGKVMGEVGA